MAYGAHNMSNARNIANLPNGDDAPIYACRAWINFNGHNSVSIRASGNVSSITDNADGDYTITFDTPMPDANYAIVSTDEHNSGSYYRMTGIDHDSPPSASSFTMNSLNWASGALLDIYYFNVAVFR